MMKNDEQSPVLFHFTPDVRFQLHPDSYTCEKTLAHLRVAQEKFTLNAGGLKLEVTYDKTQPTITLIELEEKLNRIVAGIQKELVLEL